MAQSSFFERIKRVTGRLLKLRKIIKDEKPDLVAAFMSANNIGAILASLGLKNKTIISVRVDPPMEYPGIKGWLVSRLILPLASGCVFQTDDAKKWFSTKLQKKSAVIFNSVKPDFFNITRKPLKGEIISLGRLTPQKNQIMLINAVNELHKKYPDLKLKIYGEGPLRKNFEDVIKNLNAQDFIKLTGRTNDVPKALETAEIFILTSDFEGMPNALMEAMAAGLPCISTDCPCGGAKALINNFENGILIPVGDYQALIKSIEFLLTNPEKAAQIGEAAGKSSLNFTPDKIFNDWKKYFEATACR